MPIPSRAFFAAATCFIVLSVKSDIALDIANTPLILSLEKPACLSNLSIVLVTLSNDEFKSSVALLNADICFAFVPNTVSRIPATVTIIPI